MTIIHAPIGSQPVAGIQGPQTLVFQINDDWDVEQIDEAIVNLRTIMLMLDEELTSIRGQLDRAKAARHTTGEYADPVWFSKASAALRHKGRQRQSYQQCMGELNRRRRALNRARDAKHERSDARAFISAAKVLLPPETYLLIWDEVHRRANAPALPEPPPASQRRGL